MRTEMPEPSFIDPAMVPLPRLERVKDVVNPSKMAKVLKLIKVVLMAEKSIRVRPTVTAFCP